METLIKFIAGLGLFAFFLWFYIFSNTGSSWVSSGRGGSLHREGEQRHQIGRGSSPPPKAFADEATLKWLREQSGQPEPTTNSGGTPCVTIPIKSARGIPLVGPYYAKPGYKYGRKGY